MKATPRFLISAAVLVGIALGFYAGGAVATADAQPSADAARVQVMQQMVKGMKSALVLNITSGPKDPHAVTMALQLAGHALDDERPVVIFLNVRAPVLASKKGPADLAFRDNPPIVKMLKDLMGRGATVLVCPHCMKAMGVTEADLIEGMQVASRETLFAQLGPNSVVFSY